MSVSTRGMARIRHRQTGEIYEIEANELDWQQGAADERAMGPEVGHFAEIDHAQLGPLSWEIWEYPLGVENMQGVDVGEHTLIDNFSISLDSGDDGDDDDSEARVEAMVDWFFENFEDPAQRTPYETAEGGYIWIWGGPYDAREVLDDQFQNEDPRLIEIAVRRIERDGTEWVPVSSPEDYDAERSEDEGDDEDEQADGVDLEEVAEALGRALREIPADALGPTFAPQDDGRLALLGWTDAPGSVPAAGFEDVLIVELRETAGALIDVLAGTNAHQDLFGAAERYAQALEAPELSISRLLARGIAVENTADVARDEIQLDNRPPLSAEAQRQLKTLLDLHATYIMSTQAGRDLVAAAAAYRLPRAREDELRVATAELARAMAHAPALVAESAVEAIREAAVTIATGPRPERSTWASMLTVRGFLIAVGTILATTGTEIVLNLITSAVTASVPGAVAVQGGSAAISAAWEFMLTCAPSLQALAAALGTDAAWLQPIAHIFGWIRNKAKVRPPSRSGALS